MKWRFQNCSRQKIATKNLYYTSNKDSSYELKNTLKFYTKYTYIELMIQLQVLHW